MEKTIPAFEARRQFGKILQEVIGKGDQFVVERHGQPVAALVPMEVYNQWKQARSDFFSRIRAIQEAVDMPAEEADAEAVVAVQAVRAEKRA